MIGANQDSLPDRAPPTAGIAGLRFSSRDWPAPTRAAAINEFCTRLFRQEIKALPGGDFFLSGAIHRFEGLGIISASCGGLMARRHGAHATSNDILVNIGLVGARTVAQFGCETTIQPGEALVTTAAETGVARIPHHNRYISLCMPAKALAPGVETEARPRVIGSDNEALRLLRSYVQLFDMQSLATPQLQRLAVDHVHELVRLMLCTRRADGEIAEARGVRAARLQAIKQDVVRHLDTDDVSIGALAARHRLTPRYVQMLFEADNTTLTEFVLAQRLERVQRRLRDPRRHEKIAAVAFDCGFGDLSYFNRAFRARFDATPSEVRAQARRES